MWRGVLGVLAVCILAQAETPKDELKKLAGNWQMVLAENQGNKAPEDQVKATTLEIKGDKYSLNGAGGILTGTLKLDPKQKPKGIDSTTSDGQVLLGIYELKPDEFRVCLAAVGKQRPKDFASGDFLQVWKRPKK